MPRVKLTFISLTFSWGLLCSWVLAKGIEVERVDGSFWETLRDSLCLLFVPSYSNPFHPAARDIDGSTLDQEHGDQSSELGGDWVFNYRKDTEGETPSFLAQCHDAWHGSPHLVTFKGQAQGSRQPLSLTELKEGRPGSLMIYGSPRSPVHPDLLDEIVCPLFQALLFGCFIT